MAKFKDDIFATVITTIISVISFTATFSPVASAEILYFGPGALPNCAYECIPLWSAQYDCPEETTPGECFCKSKHLAPLLEGKVGSICEDQCPENSGGAVIQAWFDSVCVSFLNRQTTSPSITTLEPTQTTDSPSPTDTSTENEKNDESGNDQEKPKEKNKAIEWWKKNWHWFLIAFLAITVPITIYAFWFPCHKWVRRQIIQRRSRPTLPPVGPISINNGHNPYANGGLASPGIPPIPSGTFTNQPWADPFSPSLTRDGVGYFPHYVAPTPSPLGAVRQESWERRVREEFEGKKTIGERLAFWKKDRKGDEGDVEGKMEGAEQTR